MGCAFTDIDWLKDQVGAAAGFSDECIRYIMDAGLDFVFAYIGHGFGQALRIWNDDSLTNLTLARVAVDSAGLKLRTKATGYDATDTLSLTTYTLLGDLVAAINALEDGSGNSLGWNAAVVGGMDDQPSAQLTHIPWTSVMKSDNTAAGYEYRLTLCLDDYAETLDGNGESHLFLRLPIRVVSAVTEDGSSLTENTHYWVKKEGWLIRMGAVGSQYCKYSRGRWSVYSPNNICVRYTPRWWGLRPAQVMLAIQGLALLTFTDTGFQAERMGDYSYEKDGGSSAMIWLSGMGMYMYNFIVI